MSESVSQVAPRSRGHWQRLSLAQQFALASSVILIVGMVTMGLWVADKIQTGVTQNTASATALYMDSFLAPIVQELAVHGELSPASRQTLDRIFSDTPHGHSIIALKIWLPGGRVAYSNHPTLIGQTFPMTAQLSRAWAGIVTTAFDDLDAEADALERAIGLPLLEMYSPVRDAKSGRVIAVAEIYEVAEDLKRELFNAQLQSWLVVAAATLLIVALLAGIFRRGSQTIELQRAALEDRIDQLSRLLKQNEDLRARAQQSSLRATEINEHFLRRISADLHDGPAQLLGLGLLRLDDLIPHPAATSDQSATQDRDLETIRRVLTDALSEVRNLSAGLALPELEDFTLRETLDKAVQLHERRTETKVRTKYGNLPDGIAMPLKISAYRFIQEALANAFQHGEAKDQQVGARYDCNELEITVSDSGPGFDITALANQDGLGLLGLRERIESMGGKLEIDSDVGRGARLTARIPLVLPRLNHD
jgi:signal transduction histidine kinase